MFGKAKLRNLGERERERDERFFILLSCSLYVPLFQFSTFIFFITIICCTICLCTRLGRSDTHFVFIHFSNCSKLCN